MGCLKLTEYKKKLPRRWIVLCRKIKTTNPMLNYMNGANLISNYSYENDVLGRRINMGIYYNSTKKSNEYNCNPRSEVIGAHGDTLNQAFDYDNIGNRITSSNNDITTNYSTNNLNQYETVGDFVPLFDEDGNQTKIKTSKGEFLVEYNGENRPVKFTNLSDSTFITMKYDYMGRRGGKLHFNPQGQWQSTAKFFYKDYTLIEESSASNDVLKEFVWDPTAGSATRPLFLRLPVQAVNLLYCHDANKNVTEVSYLSTANGIGAHYEYDSFGNTITSTRNTRVSSPDLRTYNPFRFSSEYHDSELDLIYYNYRHYNPQSGRWINRDPIAERGGINLYNSCYNSMISMFDYLGLESCTKEEYKKGAIRKGKMLSLSVWGKSAADAYSQMQAVEGFRTLISLLDFLGHAKNTTEIVSKFATVTTKEAIGEIIKQKVEGKIQELGIPLSYDQSMIMIAAAAIEKIKEIAENLKKQDNARIDVVIFREKCVCKGLIFREYVWEEAKDPFVYKCFIGRDGRFYDEYSTGYLLNAKMDGELTEKDYNACEKKAQEMFK